MDREQWSFTNSFDNITRGCLMVRGGSSRGVEREAEEEERGEAGRSWGVEDSLRSEGEKEGSVGAEGEEVRTGGDDLSVTSLSEVLTGEDAAASVSGEEVRTGEMTPPVTGSEVRTGGDDLSVSGSEVRTGEDAAASVSGERRFGPGETTSVTGS